MSNIQVHKIEASGNTMVVVMRYKNGFGGLPVFDAAREAAAAAGHDVGKLLIGRYTSLPAEDAHLVDVHFPPKGQPA